MGGPPPKCATKGTPLIAHLRGSKEGGKRPRNRIEMTYFDPFEAPPGAKKGLEGGPGRVQRPLLTPPFPRSPNTKIGLNRAKWHCFSFRPKQITTISYTKSRLCTSKTPPHGSIYIEIAWIFLEKTPI